MTISNPVYQEEISAYGYAKIGRLEESSLEWFRNDIVNRKIEEVDRLGSDYLAHRNILHVVMASADPHYSNFASAPWVQTIVETVLAGDSDDGKPTVQNAIGYLHTKTCDTRSRYKFSRSMTARDGEIWSVDLYVALTDHTKENGATEIVRGSHLGEDGWSTAFLEKNRKPLLAKAGDVFLFDSAMYRRPGINMTDEPRLGMSFQYQR